MTNAHDDAAYTARVKELACMSRWRLAHIWRLHNPDVVHVAVPPEEWNVDELTNEILRSEFPEDSAV